MPTPLLLGGQEFVFYNDNSYINTLARPLYKSNTKLKKNNNLSVIGKGNETNTTTVMMEEGDLQVYYRLSKLFNYLIIILIFYMIYLIYDEFIAILNITKNELLS